MSDKPWAGAGPSAATPSCTAYASRRRRSRRTPRPPRATARALRRRARRPPTRRWWCSPRRGRPPTTRSVGPARSAARSWSTPPTRSAAAWARDSPWATLRREPNRWPDGRRGARGEGLQHHGLAEHEGSRLRGAAGDDARVWRRRRGESRGGGPRDVDRVRGDRRRPAEDRAAARAVRDAVDPPRAVPRDGHRDRVPPAAALGPELAARVGERGGDRLRQPRPELVVEVAEVGERLEPLAAVLA